MTASTYAGNAGTGIVPATVARTYQVVGRHDQRPELLVDQGQALGLPARRHGLLDRQLPDDGHPGRTLARTDARHVQKGPFNQKVYRITNAANRAAGKTGIFIYCEQHAREWVGGITCLETAQRLVTNYATDPTTKSYVDNLDIFILPVVNPDGTHASFYDNAAQRKNLTNYCAPTSASYYVASRNSWGVDLNRNNSIGSIFDGYSGASSSCTSDTFSGPSEVSEPEIKNEHWVVDNVPEDQVRHEPAHARRLLHVGAGRVHRGGPQDAAGAEHRHREVLLRGLRRRPVADQVVAQHGDPAAAHGPDRRRALLGRR